MPDNPRIIDAHSGLRGVLIDADRGQPIRFARWANLETGEFKAFRSDPAEAKRLGIPLSTLLYEGRARLRFEERFVYPKSNGIAPSVAAALARTRRTYQHVQQIEGQECEARGCHKLANWAVTDERECAPTPGGFEGRLCQTAEITHVSLLCHKHYREPRWTSLRGVESEVPITQGGRPM